MKRPKRTEEKVRTKLETFLLKYLTVLEKNPDYTEEGQKRGHARVLVLDPAIKKSKRMPKEILDLAGTFIGYVNYLPLTQFTEDDKKSGRIYWWFHNVNAIAYNRAAFIKPRTLKESVAELLENALEALVFLYKSSKPIEIPEFNYEPNERMIDFANQFVDIEEITSLTDPSEAARVGFYMGIHYALNAFGLPSIPSWVNYIAKTSANEIIFFESRPIKNTAYGKWESSGRYFVLNLTEIWDYSVKKL